jgi:hypothetical protein
MLARRLSASTLADWNPDALAGAVLLAPARLHGTTLSKGTRLDPAPVCCVMVCPPIRAR